MKLHEILRRIEQRLAETGMSATAAERAAGAKDSIRNMRRAIASGRGGVSTRTIEKLAAALGVTPAWLLHGGSPQNVSVGEHRAEKRDNPPLQNNLDATSATYVTSIPVRGLVAAGLWMDDDSEFYQTAEMIPAAPGYDPAVQVAYRVTGNSMDLAGIADGSYVICIDIHHAPEIESGDIVAVERRQGHLIERTCKEVVAAGKNFELWPRSSDPKHASPIIVRRSDGACDDGIEVAIVGVVIGAYSPVGRRRRS